MRICYIMLPERKPTRGLLLLTRSNGESVASSQHFHQTLITSSPTPPLSTGKLPEDDKTKRMADLTECLRTYDALQLWRDAEDVLRRDVLREFVKKVYSHS
ncbi:hypothetical protein EDB85DRAFT_383367 [Lactarius pseudohatsudake]|nr:hypothetical protein EDB85DRAFT_383367 [Lactarius pseudohatsudake]